MSAAQRAVDQLLEKCMTKLSKWEEVHRHMTALAREESTGPSAEISETQMARWQKKTLESITKVMLSCSEVSAVLIVLSSPWSISRCACSRPCLPRARGA